MEWVAGPFRAYLRGLLLEHLSKFITNIDIKHIGVTSDIVLRDVELNVAQLNAVCAPRFVVEFHWTRAWLGAGFRAICHGIEIARSTSGITENNYSLAVALF